LVVSFRWLVLVDRRRVCRPLRVWWWLLLQARSMTVPLSSVNGSSIQFFE
jgi:hypothetical protein